MYCLEKGHSGNFDEDELYILTNIIIISHIKRDKS